MLCTVLTVKAMTPIVDIAKLVADLVKPVMDIVKLVADFVKLAAKLVEDVVKPVEEIVELVAKLVEKWGNNIAELFMDAKPPGQVHLAEGKAGQEMPLLKIGSPSRSHEKLVCNL